jgi:hypothetical protein
MTMVNRLNKEELKHLFGAFVELGDPVCRLSSNEMTCAQGFSHLRPFKNRVDAGRFIRVGGTIRAEAYYRPCQAR